MSRPQRDPRASVLLQHQQRRGRLPGAGGDPGDEVLDLFSRNRRSVPVAAEDADRRSGGAKSGNTGVESVKQPRGGIEDLLSGSEMGKHDYDWLLTPPGTPLRSSMESTDQLISVPSRSNLSARPSISTMKASRFSSMPQPDNNQPTRPARSNSLTRSAVSSYSGHFSNNSNKTSVLNTSTASITSFRPSTPTRPATPTRRATPASNPTLSVSKQATPVSRPVTSRPSTPAKTRPALSSHGDKPHTNQTPNEKPRSLHSSRPSTPTSRAQISSHTSLAIASGARQQVAGNLNSSSNSIIARPSSRPSTPTRRTSAPSTPISRSSSVGRVPSLNARNSGPPSRPSSPGPKPRPAVQPILLPDFSLDSPPNLRTKVPERATSAGKTRPGAALTVRPNPNSEPSTVTNPPRRQSSSPIIARGRFPENSPRARIHSNINESTPPDIQKISASDGSFRKPAKAGGAVESTGFGRTISKKSLDMALRHMDIRQGMGSIRGASLFPQSIRSSGPKTHPGRKSDSLVYPSLRNGNDTEEVYCNGTISGSGSVNDGFSENGDGIGYSPDRSYLMARAFGPDVFESSRYDTILLKEDSKNMSWLHSIEDKSDQGSIFDHRFEPLPEPFGLI